MFAQSGGNAKQNALRKKVHNRAVQNKPANTLERDAVKKQTKVSAQ
tara:strand:- start:28 stop:165 length:138 start_codon:yes stop_codon:yes gene_type:complete